MWALRARPDAIRHLRAYRHLPPLRWLTDLARAAVYRRQTHYVVERDLYLEGMAHSQDNQAVYRHPRVRSSGPLAPGCVVVVDVPVDRGCPILAWPPPPGFPAPPVRRDTPCFRGGTTFLVAAAEHDSVFSVDSSGLFGWRCDTWTSLRRTLTLAPIASFPLSRLFETRLSATTSWVCCELVP